MEEKSIEERLDDLERKCLEYERRNNKMHATILALTDRQRVMDEIRKNGGK